MMPHAVFVDVHPNARATIDRALESLGRTPGHVSSPADAGPLLSSSPAELLFAPSFDVARGVLAESSDGVATAVVVCTDGRPAAAAALRAGADAVIDTSDPVELVSALIDRALERTRTRSSYPPAPPPAGDAPRPLEEVAREAAEEAERRHIFSVLASVRGNRTRAASLLGVARSTLWHKLRRYGLENGSSESESASPQVDPGNGASR